MPNGPPVAPVVHAGSPRASDPALFGHRAARSGLCPPGPPGPADVGRQALERVLLTVVQRGLVASFATQPLECPELRHLLLDPAFGTGHPQTIVRPGYGPEGRAHLVDRCPRCRGSSPDGRTHGPARVASPLNSATASGSCVPLRTPGRHRRGLSCPADRWRHRGDASVHARIGPADAAGERADVVHQHIHAQRRGRLPRDQ